MGYEKDVDAGGMSEGGNRLTQIQAAKLYLDPNATIQGRGYWTGKYSPKGKEVSGAGNKAEQARMSSYQEKADGAEVVRHFDPAGPQEEEETIKSHRAKIRRAYFHYIGKALNNFGGGPVDSGGGRAASAGRGKESTPANRDKRVFAAIVGDEDSTSTEDKDELSVNTPAEDKEPVNPGSFGKALTRHDTIPAFYSALKQHTPGSPEHTKLLAAHANHKPLLNELSKHPAGSKVITAMNRAANSHTNAGFHVGAARVNVQHAPQVAKAIGTKTAADHEKPMKQVKKAPTAKVGASANGNKVYNYRGKAKPSGSAKPPPVQSDGKKPSTNPADSMPLELNPQKVADKLKVTVDDLKKVASGKTEKEFIGYFSQNGAAFLRKYKVPESYLQSLYTVLTKSFRVNPKVYKAGTELRALTDSLVVSGVTSLAGLATFLAKSYDLSPKDAKKNARDLHAALKQEGALR